MKTNEYLKLQKHLDLTWDGDINMYSRNKGYVIFMYSDTSFAIRDVTGPSSTSLRTPSLRVLLKLARLNGI